MRGDSFTRSDWSGRIRYFEKGTTLHGGIGYFVTPADHAASYIIDKQLVHYTEPEVSSSLSQWCILYIPHFHKI